VKASEVERRLRKVCLALPEVSERPSHGAPAFFAGRQFAILWMNGHHDHEFAHLWCAAPEGVQHQSIADNPDRFFYPPYVGSRGWLGVRLDGEIDLDELEMLLDDAYRCVANKRQLTLLDASRD
jgi:hypothetical protein